LDLTFKWGWIMGLSASCEDTLRLHVNACIHHRTAYHWRSQKQTLSVKEKSFHNQRSIATVKRDDRRLRDEKFITKQRRKGNSNVGGRQWKSSITHPTWDGIKHLVKRHLLPRSFFALWKEICGYVQKKGPRDLRDEPDPKSPLFGVPGDANGWPYRGPPAPKET